MRNCGALREAIERLFSSWAPKGLPVLGSQAGISHFSFIVYGDSRYANSNPTFNPDHRDVACLGILRGGCMSEEEYPAFILHTGDLACEGGDVLEWIPHFFRPAGALISRIPVFPCVGNHETRDGDGAVTLTCQGAGLQTLRRCP